MLVTASSVDTFMRRSSTASQCGFPLALSRTAAGMREVGTDPQTEETARTRSLWAPHLLPCVLTARAYRGVALRHRYSHQYVGLRENSCLCMRACVCTSWQPRSYRHHHGRTLPTVVRRTTTNRIAIPRLLRFPSPVQGTSPMVER